MQRLMHNDAGTEPDAIHGETHAKSGTVSDRSQLPDIKPITRIPDVDNFLLCEAGRRCSDALIDNLFGT
jgi:hypothetical protein